MLRRRAVRPGPNKTDMYNTRTCRGLHNFCYVTLLGKKMSEDGKEKERRVGCNDSVTEWPIYVLELELSHNLWIKERL